MQSILRRREVRREGGRSRGREKEGWRGWRRRGREKEEEERG